jgi:hypothetical protein
MVRRQENFQKRYTHIQRTQPWFLADYNIPDEREGFSYAHKIPLKKNELGTNNWQGRKNVRAAALLKARFRCTCSIWHREGLGHCAHDILLRKTLLINIEGQTQLYRGVYLHHTSLRVTLYLK